ncbi:hypothetical protein CBL_03349 [Carabus blaptoides fortunei]
MFSSSTTLKIYGSRQTILLISETYVAPFARYQLEIEHVRVELLLLQRKRTAIEYDTNDIFYTSKSEIVLVTKRMKQHFQECHMSSSRKGIKEEVTTTHEKA